MDNMQQLKKRGEEFRLMLEKYAALDKEVATFQEKVLPLLNAVRDDKITPPFEYTLGAYFSNPDFSVLAERYWNHELSDSEARFVTQLREPCA